MSLLLPWAIVGLVQSSESVSKVYLVEEMSYVVSVVVNIGK